MLIAIQKEDLVKFLKDEMKAWESVGGGPNINAFSFDPETTDPQELKRLGYYDNREAWIAGMRIKELRVYLDNLEELPQLKAK
jgi:hypothetical protein